VGWPVRRPGPTSPRLIRWLARLAPPQAGSIDEARGVGEAAAAEFDALGGEEAELAGEGGSGAFPLESAGAEVGRDHAVAGDLRGEGVGAQGLTDGAGRAAANPPAERGVGDDAAGGDAQEGVVNAAGEGGGGVSSFQCSVLSDW